MFAKLRLDLRPAQGRVVRNGDDTLDLIPRLATRIGMIMEGTSVIAITLGGLNDAKRRAAIDQIVQAAATISALAAAKTLGG